MAALIEAQPHTPVRLHMPPSAQGWSRVVRAPDHVVGDQHCGAKLQRQTLELLGCGQHQRVTSGILCSAS